MPSSVTRTDAVLVWLGGGVGVTDYSLATVGERFRHWCAKESESPHFLCWFVVCFGTGIVLFFQSSGDATAIWPVSCALMCLAIAWRCRAQRTTMRVVLALFAVFAGFASGVLRLQRVEAPLLQRTMIGSMTGYVEAVEHRAGRSPQLTIMPVTLANLPTSSIPKRIKITQRAGNPPIAGAFISAKVRLLPLPQPVRPSGYDFARDSYFRGFGAVGSVLGAVEVVASTEKPPIGLAVTAAIDRARNALTKRIYETYGGAAGGVAAALLTGKRGYIPEETNDVLRAAGIYHIVSISGLHMVIAAGMVFWFVRAVLALFIVPALRWPVKKIAAVVAMVGATAYCLFSGADVATQRSLFMTLVMLGAIIAERRVLSMRNLAIAALIILVTAPEAILGPGFQMSFAAVAALVTLAQAARHMTITVTGNWFVRSIKHSVNWFSGAVATTVVAGFATAPFAAYHFQTAVPYGLIGNALALPLVSLIVMPMGALGALAYPFSLDQPMWQIMGWATAVVVDVSRWVAALEGSLVHFPAFGAGAVVMATIAVVVATAAVSPLRYGAVIPLIASVLLASMPERYVVFIDRDGRAAAVRSVNGAMFLVGSANSFLAEQWLRADGDERDGKDAGLRKDSRCDIMSCVGEGVVTVAVVKNPLAFREDCLRADVIVSSYAAPPTCAAPVVIDRKRLNEGGAAAITRNADGQLKVRHVRQNIEMWPWQIGRAGRGEETRDNAP